MEDTEFCTVFIVRSADANKLSYVMVEEEVPFDEWVVSVDQKKEIKEPSVPDGYEEYDSELE